MEQNEFITPSQVKQSKKKRIDKDIELLIEMSLPKGKRKATLKDLGKGFAKGKNQGASDKITIGQYFGAGGSKKQVREKPREEILKVPEENTASCEPIIHK